MMQPFVVVVVVVVDDGCILVVEDVGWRLGVLNRVTSEELCCSSSE
jgi:hypothetical protein